MSENSDTAARFELSDKVLERALELEGAQRASYLDTACGDDATLRARVDALLLSAEATSEVLRPGGAFSRDLLEAVGRESRVGSRIGRYELLEELGRGGMGIVYKAIRADGAYDQTVAIKLLKPGASASAIDRFTRERQILATLDHPNIARLLDGGVSEYGEPFLAVEFVEGSRIDQYCAENELSLEERLELLVQLCAAVQAAHQRLIVHRDIKPANILITPSGTPKLLDFGIAKLVHGDGLQPDQVAATQQHAMTLQYASPEQYRGLPVTVASDVYQLGLVAYEVMSGAKPYSLAETPLATAERLITEEEPPLPSEAPRASTVGLRLAGDVDTIVMKSIRKEAERRYQSVEELRSDLERFLAGMPILARPNTLGYRAAKFLRRNLVPVSLLAGLGGLLLTSSVLFTVQLMRERDRTRAAAQIATAEKKTAVAALAESEEVLSFLVELFTRATPDAAQGKTVSLVSMLEYGREVVDARLIEQPRARMRVRWTLAELFRMQGELDRSEELLQLAIEDGDRALESGSAPAGIEPTRALVLRELGNVANRRGNLDEAVGYFQGSLEKTDRWVGSRSYDAGWLRVVLATTLMENNAFKDALSTAQVASAILAESIGPNEPDTLVARRVVADILNRLGRYQEARAQIEPIVEELRRTVPGSSSLMGALNTLANVLGNLGEYEREVELQRELLAFVEPVFPVGHQLRLVALHNLANALLEVERFGEAEQVVRRALVEARGVKNQMFEAPLLSTLSVLLSAQGQNVEALQVADRGLSLARDVLDPEHDRLGLAEHSRAVVLARLGRQDEAEDGFKKALEILLVSLERSHSSVAKALVGLAGVEIELASFDAAVLHAKEAFVSRDAILPLADRNRLEALELWMKALSANGTEVERVALERLRTERYRESVGTGR